MTDIVFVHEIWGTEQDVNNYLKEGWKLLNVVTVHNPSESKGHFLVYVVGADKELYDKLELGKPFNSKDLI